MSAGMSDDTIEQVVLEVLTSVLGSQPSLETPLVQAGLDSLGETYTQLVLLLQVLTKMASL